ncbi:MAG: ribosome silencing factor [Treponema sp.]|jgi:ribosome-associated protein|nr:ribosome silencing factor [Treponema sp.]
MEEMLSKTENTDVFQIVKQLAELLQAHNGQDVALLDLRTINDWTDFFIIATISSKTHMDGLERHIKDFCREKEIEILGISPKSTGDEWRLIDLGSAIIHLMNSQARDFYELEKLWRGSSSVL